MENGGMIEKAVETEVKADDGRVILYATRGEIKKVGQTSVNSLIKRGSTSHSNFKVIIPQKSKKSTIFEKKCGI